MLDNLVQDAEFLAGNQVGLIINCGAKEIDGHGHGQRVKIIQFRWRKDIINAAKENVNGVLEVVDKIDSVRMSG